MPLISNILMPTAKYDTYKVISFMNEYRKERKLGFFYYFIVLFIYLLSLFFYFLFLHTSSDFCLTIKSQSLNAKC